MMVRRVVCNQSYGPLVCCNPFMGTLPNLDHHIRCVFLVFMPSLECLSVDILSDIMGHEMQWRKGTNSQLKDEVFGNMKPLAKIVFFLEYTRGLLCWYVRDVVKAVVFSNHSGQKCIHAEIGTTTDGIRDTVSQCLCCHLIASSSGS